jgi:hypothetical protein
MKLSLIVLALALALSPARAEENCFTQAEGSLITRALDLFVRQNGLTVDSGNAVMLAQKLQGIVNRCETAAAVAAHDAQAAKEKPASPEK